MKQSVAGGAAALLEKSRSHMRGQHYTSEGRGTSRNTKLQQPVKKNEEEDIAVYLSQISKKVPGKQKMDDISSGLSDLSLCDDVKNSNTMKFIKKSSTASATGPGSPQIARHIQQSSRTIPGKTSMSFTSSALERASKLNAKITSRKIMVDSDSSEDGSDKYQELIVTASIPEVRDKYRFMKKPLSKALEPSASVETKQENLALYNTQIQDICPHMALDAKESSIMAESTKSKKGGGATMPLTSTPVRNSKQTNNSSRNVYSKNSRNVYGKIMAELDTDDENMDYLLRDIDESSSHSKLKEMQQTTVSDQVSDDGFGPQRLSNNGYAVGDMEHLSADESSVQSSIAEDVGLTLADLQTIDDLLPPSTLYTQHMDTSHKRRDSSHERRDSSYERRDSSQKCRDSSHKLRDSSPDKDSESMKTMSPLIVEDSISTVPDTPEIVSMTVADSYSSVASYCSKSSLSKSRSKSDLKSSLHRSIKGGSKISDSSINTITPTRSVSYSHDFDTLSHSEDTTISDDQTIASDFSTSHIVSSSRSSQPSDFPKHKGRDAAVQTCCSLHSINHHWLKDYDFQTPGYFKLLSTNIKDPVSHFVDPSVLQTISSFDCSSFVLHANLSEQVRQTQLAVTNTMRQHQAFLDSLQEDYSYTTLENTKLFIKRQKKRRKHKDQGEMPLEEGEWNADL